MKSRDIFIYGLVDPLTKLVRYVGKSVVPYKRYSQHIKIVESAKRRKQRWINSLLRENVKPLLIILEVTRDQEWQKYEKKWIKFCRDKRLDLTNHTDGGDGLHNPDNETKMRMSKSRKKLFEDEDYRKWYRENVAGNLERCNKISKKLKGKKKSKEHIKKLPQNSKGYIHKEGFGSKISSTVSGKNNPMYGNHFSKIWIKKYGMEKAIKMLKEQYGFVGEKQRGKKQDSQYNLLVKKYGKNDADIIYKNINDKRSKTLTGTKRSDETKKKMSIARKIYWNNKK